MSYVQRARKTYSCGGNDQISLLVDGDEVEITYRLEPLGVDRIPRMIEGGEVSGCMGSAACPKAGNGAEHA